MQFFQKDKFSEFFAKIQLAQSNFKPSLMASSNNDRKAPECLGIAGYMTIILTICPKVTKLPVFSYGLFGEEITMRRIFSQTTSRPG